MEEEGVTGGEVVEGRLRKINIANESERHSMFSGRGENPLCADAPPPPPGARHQLEAGSWQILRISRRHTSSVVLLPQIMGCFASGITKRRSGRDPAVDPSVYNTPIQLVLLHVSCLNIYEGKGLRINKDEEGVC